MDAKRERVRDRVERRGRCDGLRGSKDMGERKGWEGVMDGRTGRHGRAEGMGGIKGEGLGRESRGKWEGVKDGRV